MSSVIDFLDSGCMLQPNLPGESSMTTAKPPATALCGGARAGGFALASYTITGNTSDFGSLRTCRATGDSLALLSLRDSLLIDPAALGECSQAFLAI